MQPQPTFPKPHELLAIFLRRRWYFILPVIAVLAAGSVLVVKLPKKYTASTTIMVQAQKLPEEYVRPVITEDLSMRANAISEQIMSRTNLERIIERFNLFKGPEHERMFLEDKVANLRRSITVDVRTNDRRREDTTFRISHVGTDPVLVRDITQTLASNFIEEDLKMREAYTTGTSSFLEEELRAMEGRLKEREDALRVYREKNRGGLPEQLEANLRQIERIQTQLIETQNNLYQAENQLMMLERQESQVAMEVPARAGAEGAGQRPRINPRALLEDLNVQYNDMLSRYTEQHPDLIRLANRIKELEAAIARDQGGQGNADAGEVVVGSYRNFDQIQAQQISDTQLRIRLLSGEIGRLKGELDMYQQRVNQTPRAEEELLTLQRDYENINALYNSLLNRKLEAEIAINMEKKQKGEQFRIVDPATLPQKPSSPDMNKLFLMVMMAAFGSGAGLLFLLEYTDGSIRKPEQMEALTGIPVLASVPSILKASEKLKKRIGHVVFGAASALTLVLVVCFTGLSLLGVGPFLDLARKALPFV